MSKAKKTEGTVTPKCPVTREQFNTKAPATITLTVTDSAGKELGKLVAMRREFESGSLGYYAGDKIVMEIDGQPVRVQCGLNFTVVGSKELPK